MQPDLFDSRSRNHRHVLLTVFMLSTTVDIPFTWSTRPIRVRIFQYHAPMLGNIAQPWFIRNMIPAAQDPAREVPAGPNILLHGIVKH